MRKPPEKNYVNKTEPVRAIIKVGIVTVTQLSFYREFEPGEVSGDMYEAMP